MAKSKSGKTTKSANDARDLGAEPMPISQAAASSTSNVVALPSDYTVVARRYRPQQFADLVGQEHVANALTNAIASQRIAHAFLFTGARGTGKTSTARILAKALNCVNGPTVTPCDRCPSCRAIIDGSDLDVLEIDGASNNKVDEIRDLKSNVGFRPQRGRFKIYIIDEVHMLTVAAFNALLKTLEEPPPHVKFIFATTEVQKIPITILSRCQRYDFAAINPARVLASLKQIVQKEGLAADEEALQLISRRAAGSMRDGQTLLDQLLSYADGKLTAARVHELLGTATDDRLQSLAEAILNQDSATALQLVAEAANQGLQLGELLDQLIDYFRGLMLLRVAGPDVRDLPGSFSLQEHLKQQVERLSLDTILAGLDILTTAKQKLRSTSYVQVVVEMTVVRLSMLQDLISVATLAQQLGGGVVVANKLPQSNSSQMVSPRPSPANPAVEPASKKNDRVTNESDASHVKTTCYGDLSEENLPRVWQATLQKLGAVRAGQLEPVKLPAIIGPNSLAIRFPAAYSSWYQLVAKESSLEQIRQALKQVTQRDCRIVVELLPGPSNERAPDATGSSDHQPPGNPARYDQKRELMKLPLFEKASRTLGALLMKVDEGFNPHEALRSENTTSQDDDYDDNPLYDLPAPPEVDDFDYE